MKKIICVLISVLMLAAMSCTVFASDEVGVKPGDPMPDFTVSLTDGSDVTLSGLLQENDLVVLNVFATWCGPCEIEFPDMEKVYQANSDRMVILSLSGDPDDTMEMIADYQSSHSITFPMGSAGGSLDFLNVTAFPSTFFIDREGSVGFIKVGAFVGEGAFEEKVNTFLSDNYNGKPLPSEIAKSRLPQLFVLVLGSWLLLLAGRWCLFRKAGRPGWHSLIPVLASYQEFALGWKGWIGILSLVSQLGIMGFLLFTSHANWTIICAGICLLVFIILRIKESLKLAKAFGQGAGTGILLMLFQNAGRFVLGVSKARYQNYVK